MRSHQKDWENLTIHLNDKELEYFQRATAILKNVCSQKYEYYESAAFLRDLEVITWERLTGETHIAGQQITHNHCLSDNVALQMINILNKHPKLLKDKKAYIRDIKLRYLGIR